MKRILFKNKELVLSLLVILPAFAIFTAFTYIPLLSTLVYSLTDWNGFSKSFHFVGILNFINVFKDGDVLLSFWNTFYFAMISLAIGTIVQLSLALLLFGAIKGKNIFRALFYLPCVISQLIISMTWQSFFQYTGIINEFLKIYGLYFLVIDWLGNPSTVKNVLAFINVWQWAGYGMVIFLAGLYSIPGDIYESAMIDGANSIKKFFYITLPLLMPSITVMAFLGTTGALKIFDMPYVLTGGGPMNASLTLSMSIYNAAFSYQKFGYSSSIGLTFFILIAVITVLQLRTTGKLEVEH